MINNNKSLRGSDWFLTIILLLISVLLTYLTKVWFLFLLFPLSIFAFKKEKMTIKRFFVALIGFIHLKMIGQVNPSNIEIVRDAYGVPHILQKQMQSWPMDWPGHMRKMILRLFNKPIWQAMPC